MSITVHCTHCNTGFPVDPAKVPEGGVRARCTTCEGIFRVELPERDVAVEGGGAAEAEVFAELSEAELPEEVFPELPEGETTETTIPDPHPDSLEVEAFGEVEAPKKEEDKESWGFDEVSPPVGEPDEPERFTDVDFDMDPFEYVEASGTADTDESEAKDPEADDGETLLSAEWVFETEEAVGPDAVEVDRLDTVEEQIRGFQDETYEAPPSEGIDRVVPGREDEAFEGYSPAPMGDASVEAEAPEETSGAGSGGETPPVEEVGTGEGRPPSPTAFQFGRRDPRDKARRLARVLVSDMITYNPERHARALETGRLREDFEEEISKSWSEYVDQVGAEIAESTTYWQEALNEVLARGEKLF